MTDFARLMSDYFVKYLAGQKGSGSNTMKTYRDTFVQLLEFMDEKKHIRADCIEVDSFSYDIINEFLEYLEKEKRVSISTRNNRLASRCGSRRIDYGFRFHLRTICKYKFKI